MKHAYTANVFLPFEDSSKFIAFAVSQGWEEQEPKGEYEYIRLHKNGRYALAYRRNCTTDLTLFGDSAKLFFKFFTAQKKEKQECTKKT